MELAAGPLRLDLCVRTTVHKFMDLGSDVLEQVHTGAVAAVGFDADASTLFSRLGAR